MRGVTLQALRGRNARIVTLGLVAVALTAWGCLRYVRSLDARFLAPSAPGFKGLVLYFVGDYEGAARAYRAHLRAAIAARKERIDPAWAAFVSGDLTSARSIARARLERSEDAEALLTLAEVELADGRPAETLTLVHQAARRHSARGDAELLGSVASARLGRYDDAIAALGRMLRTSTTERRPTAFLSALETVGVLTKPPMRERPLGLLAHYHRYLRIFDASQGKVAILYARKAIEVGDRADDAHVTIGIIDTKQGKWAAALEEFLAAARLNPGNPEALRWAALTYARRGDLVNEARMMRAAFDAAPAEPYYAEAVHDVLVEKLGDYRQALALYATALHTYPQNARLWYNIADVHRLLGDDERSIDGFRRASTLDSGDHAAPLMLGWAYYRMDKNREALEQFERAVALSPRAGETHYGIAAVNHALRRYPDAIAAYERSFALRPLDDVEYLVPLCDLYAATSAFDRAEQCLRAVLARDPRHVSAQRRLRDVMENLALRRRGGR